MRIALLADIHGNHVALESVLDHMAGRGVDQIVCLGDVAVLGPEPAAVIRRLRGIGCPTVLGNVDAWLLGALAAEPAASDSAEGIDLTAWSWAQLDAADLAWLRAMPRWLDVALGDVVTLRCCHGSPRSHGDVVMNTTPDDELAMMFGNGVPAIVAGGHTHVAMVRCWRDTLLVNPGSVGLPGVGPGTPGLPVNRGVRWAEYGIVTLAGGTTTVELHRIPLDLDQVLAAATRTGMPHAGWWADQWVARSVPSSG